jgi:hypothetical protein
MELINGTRMVAGFNMGLEPSGRELLVVVIKGTFILPKPGETLRLHDEQLPLVMADTFTGQPGFSAPLQEVDFAPRKHQCDVLLTGSAHAPGGRPVTRTQVALSVGRMCKTIDVVGPRVWQAGLTGIRASDPQAFVRQPVSYDQAFGGVDQASDDPREHDAFMRNPVGKGFHKQLKSEWVDGQPLPGTEKPGEPVNWPSDAYEPMAFGPLGRVWQQRACHGGTYDQQWLDNEFPFLPKDFDERYFQAAPLDQQIALPREPLDISLLNLTPDGVRRFTLPNFEAPVHIFPKNGEREDGMAQLDTIVFEPDEERFSLTWRYTRPLKKSLHEISQVMVGKRSKAWWRSMHPWETFPAFQANLPT